MNCTMYTSYFLSMILLNVLTVICNQVLLRSGLEVYGQRQFGSAIFYVACFFKTLVIVASHIFLSSLSENFSLTASFKVLHTKGNKMVLG